MISMWSTTSFVRSALSDLWWRFLGRLPVSRRASVDRYYLLRTRFGSLFVHHIKRDDRSDTFHTHPWWWVSVIWGYYDDQRLGGEPRRKWFLNWCGVDTVHRVTLPRGPVWTFLVHGPRRRRWKVYSKGGTLLEVEPWRGMGNVARKEYYEP